MKRIHPVAAIPLAGLASLLAFLLAGCGDFWKAPIGTGTGTSGIATTTTLSPLLNSTVSAGATVTLTATVSPSAATGTVTFYANSSSIGTAALSSGTATLNVSFASAGTESLTATYGGDSTYASSSSSAITLTVTAASGSGSSLPALSESSGAARVTNLVLDPEAPWTPPATVHLHNIAGVAVGGSTVLNIDAGGRCVFYSGSIFFAAAQNSPSGADPSRVYELSGGGVLAPEGTTGLDCE